MTPKSSQLFSTMIGLLLLVSSPSIRALTNGVPDTGNTYSNVGAVFAVGPDGHAIQLCSGTLISPTVFLTVAHCVAYFNSFLAPEGFALYMSFANPIPFLELTDVNTLIPVTAIIPNPNYIPANDTHPLTPIHRGDPADLAVIILPAAVTQGIAPATLPTAGLLDELSAHNHLQGATFIAVGYGSQDKFFTQSNPLPRMFAFSTFRAVTPAFLQLSINPAHENGGACYGDSGGPQFLAVDGTLILTAINSIGGDHNCRAMSHDYRVDTTTARDFLAQFVALP